ncbi:NAD(P)-dependent oxidoreductase [Actinoplanes sp. TFC3]|uniref:NAD-dependent epimerase/dehydratase family protein n=1 Tax=Actinoplanes sp. TFC3 TaxID=1710355 RepID=UPI00082FACEF|nr:NAD-dependent epimerase/dehydratase family protein [Actinoplanes sp. TFC3]
MDIVGNGFLARNLAGLAGRHRGVVAIAAGASSTAATGPELDREADLVAAVVRECRQDRRTVIFFSTASHALYGSTRSPARENGPVCPASAFGRHKLRIEHLIAGSGVAWLILRLSHAAGPYQRSHQFFPAMVHAVQSGSVLVHRHAARDLIDVADVVRVVDALVQAGVSGEVINIATGRPYPVLDVVAALESALARPVDIEFADRPPAAVTVSVAKLHRLLPGLRLPEGTNDDLDDLVRRYAPLYAGSPA